MSQPNYTYPFRRATLCIMAGALAAAVLLAPVPAAAQGNTTTFSPYTIYGLGDGAVGGSSFNRAMGGIGVGYRNPFNFNYLNPASMSAMPQQSALFNIGAEGQNIYSKTQYTSTSFNSFNMHDLGIAFPLAKGVGLGFSMTPVSSVGYTSRIIDDDSDVISDIGRAVYEYSGDGGVTQIAMSLGVKITPNLSLGANLIYWFGNIERQYNTIIYPFISNDSYRAASNSETLNVSKVLGEFGAQYTVKLAETKALTLGATYQPKVNTSIKHTDLSLSIGGSAADTVAYNVYRRDFAVPAKMAAGVYYQTSRFGVGFDYERQDWSGAFEIPADQALTLGAQQQFKLGANYTPNRFSTRNALARWTYKAGLRYGTSYLRKDNYTMNDMAVSLGVDFGLKKGTYSRVGVGLEYGERGTPANQQVKERYFRLFLSLSLYGDGWFVKQKYR